MKIILVFKTHFDIGFTDLASNVIENYAGDMLDQVIETCRATRHLGQRKFVWTMPAWPLWHLVSHCSGERKAALEELVQNGQVVWHALPFTSHTDLASPGEYLYGMRYSRLLAQRFQKPYPVSAKMTDVPGHSMMLPDLLSQADIRFLHLGSNEFASPPDVPDLFFWQSPGGRRVLTMYSRGGYGTGLIPPKDWKYPVWMALMNTHDNSGPQSAEMLEQMTEAIHKELPDAEVVCGTMDNFYRELSAYSLEDVPVVTKDLADTWIHGVGSYPAETGMLRANREMLRTMTAVYAEHLLAEDRAFEEKEGKIGRLFDICGNETTMFEEHTWGADVKTFLGPDRVYEKSAFQRAKQTAAYRFMETSWEEQRERMRRCENAGKQLEKELSGDGQEYSLFYRGSGSYTGWITLPKALRKHEVRIGAVKLPCARIQGDWCCYVENLPGFKRIPIAIADGRNTGAGCKATDDVRKSTAPDGSEWIENHRYSVCYNGRNGMVLRVYDKKLKQDLLQANESEGIFAYRYDRYGYADINEYLRAYGYHFTTWGIQDYGRENYPFCGHETYQPRFERLERDRDCLRLFYKGEDSADRYGDAEEICLEILLPEAGEDLFVQLKLKRKQESPFVESGSFLIPFAGNHAGYRIRKGGMTLDPETQIADGANHSLFCLDEGMAVMNETSGLWIESQDAPLVSFGDPGIYQYRPEFCHPEHPTVYVNLFNNMWGTNFPQWIGGNFQFRFRIRGFVPQPGEKRIPAGCLDGRKSAAVLSGVICGQKQPGKRQSEKPQSEELRSEVPLLEFPANMQLIAARKKRDGDLVITFLEREGREQIGQVAVPGFHICPCDFFGEPEKIGRAGTSTFRSVPYGTSSFLLRRETAENRQEEEALAKVYEPVLMLDEKEPFLPIRVGYTVFRTKKKSMSAPRLIDPAQHGAEFCIEYAYYYDYDIQHLYDLEHAWIYVGPNGSVQGCDCSFHGKYFRIPAKTGRMKLDGTHVVLYVQPGKHAMMPDPAGFEQLADYQSACMEDAGADGILTPDIIAGMPAHTKADDRAAARYIREQFGFEPSGRYHVWDEAHEPVLWEKLCAKIPFRIKKELEKIRSDLRGV